MSIPLYFFRDGRWFGATPAQYLSLNVDSQPPLETRVRNLERKTTVTSNSIQQQHERWLATGANISDGDCDVEFQLKRSLQVRMLVPW
jgi:hypothetical protein